MNISRPEITVLMPVYNAEMYLAEAIESILNQTYRHFEFLIIDDGSTDKSSAIIREYNDPRIRFVQNKENMGITATLNRGIELASCELIARMDADDISLPERLEKQYLFFKQHPDCGLVSTWVQRFNSEGTQNRVFQYKPEYYHYFLTFNNWISHPSVMYKCSVVKDVGMYSKVYAEDFNLWSKIIRKYKFYTISEVLLRYRIHRESLSRGMKREEYGQAHLEQLIENIHYYTGANFPVNFREAEFLRGTKLSFKPNTTEIIQCFQKLDYLTSCMLKANNVNKAKEKITRKAALEKKRMLIDKVDRLVNKRELIYILLKLNYFGFISYVLFQKLRKKGPFRTLAKH